MVKYASKFLPDVLGALGFAILIYGASYPDTFGKATSTLWMALALDLLCIPVLVQIAQLRRGRFRTAIAAFFIIGMLFITLLGIALFVQRSWPIWR
jgi:hypothetical protein